MSEGKVSAKAVGPEVTGCLKALAVWAAMQRRLGNEVSRAQKHTGWRWETGRTRKRVRRSQ